MVVQTVRHRDYFLPRRRPVRRGRARTTPSRRPRPARRASGCSCVALVAVVGLAKVESPAIEDAVASIGAPQSAVGVVIALLVLLPETLAAVRNARRDRMQTSFNLALGSAMASIGLTIPAIARRLDLARRPADPRAGGDADGAARCDGGGWRQADGWGPRPATGRRRRPSTCVFAASFVFFAFNP